MIPCKFAVGLQICTKKSNSINSLTDQAETNLTVFFMIQQYFVKLEGLGILEGVTGNFRICLNRAIAFYLPVKPKEM